MWLNYLSLHFIFKIEKHVIRLITEISHWSGKVLPCYLSLILKLVSFLDLNEIVATKCF